MNQSFYRAGFSFKELIVQRGTVRSYDKNGSGGTISRPQDSDVRFSADSVLGRDRSSLAQGDQVWYEVEQVNKAVIAINIRKCN